MLAGGLLAPIGCTDIAYYGQAASGQWHVMSLRRPVDEVLADAGVTPTLRRRLETASALREFAIDELALPDNGSYRNYVDLQRSYVVWNVFAAPELSLRPREWCFALVGCLGYRGYFNEADANALAQQLRAGGEDVYVGGVPAYSTLGWFDDPLLNTFMHWPTGRLAELVFHELAHQRLFIAGDTVFNESFATTVGHLGVRLWLDRYGTREDRGAYETYKKHKESFLALVLPVKEDLARLYDSNLTAEEKREGKRRLLTELQARYASVKQEQWGGYAGYDRWFYEDLNNAKLSALNTYTQYAPAFEALFGQAGGDFTAFYDAAEALGKLPQEVREDRLRELIDRKPGG